VSEVQEILNRYPEAKIDVLVLWAPLLRNDTRQTAQRAAAYLQDQRVQHYWDLWRFASRVYSEQLGLPIKDAWDLFAFYKPHLTWRSSAPTPTFWMQNRNLEIGTPYSKDELEKNLKVWIE
jgi:hypothetical protein